ncbi:MAG TPA: LytTR family transcriptional regulator, partial [Ohtaekwangia sp.]|uniref:LytTR family transcriptional regulator n=1 Tax=Ohtaekwangia sp. TaxID=2066019 RepID=UPI002F95B465
MRKDHLYLLTFSGISIIVVIINIVSLSRLIKISTEELLRTELEASKREANEVSRMLEVQLKRGIPTHEIAAGLQRSIENTNTETGFICMYDTSGVEICNPNPKKIGMKVTSRNSEVKQLGSEGKSTFIDILRRGKADGGLRQFLQEDRTEIIYVHPIPETPWMLAAHANVSAIQRQLNVIKINFILISTISGILIIIFSFVVVRYLGNRYEKKLEREKDSLQDDVKTLMRLNASLAEHRDKVEQEIQTESPAIKPEEKVKKRILTYWRDELVTIDVEHVAFCYTQNNLAYIHCLDGNSYTSNSSLDELFEALDKKVFFRANRQFILSIR